MFNGRNTQRLQKRLLQISDFRLALFVMALWLVCAVMSCVDQYVMHGDTALFIKIYVTPLIFVSFLVLCISAHLGRLRDRFRKTFETAVPKSPGEHGLIKRFVTKKLCMLALKFQAACQEQEDFFKEKSAIESPTADGVEAVRNQYEALSLSVRVTKRNFWDAYALATLYDLTALKNLDDFIGIAPVYGLGHR